MHSQRERTLAVIVKGKYVYIDIMHRCTCWDPETRLRDRDFLPSVPVTVADPLMQSSRHRAAARECVCVCVCVHKHGWFNTNLNTNLTCYI